MNEPTDLLLETQVRSTNPAVIMLEPFAGHLLLLLRGLRPPRADQAQRPVQERRHDGNGIAGDPIGRDVLRQEVVFADPLLIARVLLVRLPQRCMPNLIAPTINQSINDREDHQIFIRASGVSLR